MLTAVDAAVMLIDAAKGLEPQTLKLFQVCRHRGIPVITVINKWDRPGQTPLELHRRDQRAHRAHPDPAVRGRSASPATSAACSTGAPATTSSSPAPPVAPRSPPRSSSTPTPLPNARARRGPPPSRRANCSREMGQDHDQEMFLAGQTSPMIFTSAMLNFGVRQLLDALVELAPPPAGRDRRRRHRPRGRPTRSAPSCSRCRPGWTPATATGSPTCGSCPASSNAAWWSPTPRPASPFATKYAQAVFGRDRSTVDTAYPGDVVGLVNATALAPGDTLYSTPKVRVPADPVLRARALRDAARPTAGKYKQFRKAIDQLDSEGVVQVLRNDTRGDASPVLAAVGPMQFEVVTARMHAEFNVETELEPLGYSLARRTDEAERAELDRQRGVEVFTRTDGALLALFSDKWRLQYIEKEHPELTLEPLVAAAD